MRPDKLLKGFRESVFLYMERATFPRISYHCQNGSYAARALKFTSLLIIHHLPAEGQTRTSGPDTEKTDWNTSPA